MRECCICREIVTPYDKLVSSEGGPSECSTKHVFHHACLPEDYVLEHGCPVCRRSVPLGASAVLLRHCSDFDID